MTDEPLAGQSGEGSERLADRSLDENETRAAIPIAREFHETYERLAEQHGYRTRRASAVPWEDVPLANRALMVHTVWDLMLRRVIADAGGARD